MVDLLERVLPSSVTAVAQELAVKKDWTQAQKRIKDDLTRSGVDFSSPEVLVDSLDQYYDEENENNLQIVATLVSQHRRALNRRGIRGTRDMYTLLLLASAKEVQRTKATLKSHLEANFYFEDSDTYFIDNYKEALTNRRKILKAAPNQTR